MEYFALLIAGSRNFNYYDTLAKKCDHLLINQRRRYIVIVSGGARGADALAERYAKERGYYLKVFPAQWEKYGKSAGYRRNEEMHIYINSFGNRGVVCFWDGQSKGTAHNFDLCRRFHTQLRVWNYTTQNWIKMRN
jgi:hypothetical protein